jgi:TPR repeat protein
MLAGMAGEALNKSWSSNRAWQRESTRAAILQAARGLFEKGGIEQLSLGAVAAETGFATNTVFAYFTSKSELLVATVANDLATLARTMRDVYPFPDPPEPEIAPVADAPAVAEDAATGQNPASGDDDAAPPQPVCAAPMAEAEPEPQQSVTQQEPVGDVAEPAPQFTVNFPTVGKKRPLLERKPVVAEPVIAESIVEAAASNAPVLLPHPDRVDEQEPEIFQPAAEAEPAPVGGELASLKESVAKLETRKVDAWLERRLRVFEKSLADIETRLANSERDSARAASLADETAKTIAGRFDAADKRLRDGLDNLVQRLEHSEKRPRGMPPDLRATLDDLYARLETLEGARSGVTPDLEAKWSAIEEEPAPVGEEAPVEDDKPMKAAAETYLSAARRAASAAAQLADIEDTRRRRIFTNKSLTRTALIVAICAALAVLLAIYGFLLRGGVTPPAQPVAPHAATVRHVAARAATPFEHVSTLANGGNLGAELVLGLDYLNGTGVAKNPTQAARWLQLAAEGGEPVGQYWFATLYDRGIGVPANAALAFHWYQTAAIQGNRRAIYDLAVAYAVGRGTKPDMTKAAQWFRSAAQLGSIDAQYNLGVLYERGQGVPQSLNDAYKWYAIAAVSGDKESMARVAALTSQLRPDDLAAAKAAAAAFRVEPLNRAANLLPAVSTRG